MKQKISVTGNGNEYIITINVRDDEIENKSDVEIAEIIENKMRIEINKLLYGKRGV